MATIKSYTSLEQSRELAEILPLESADMYWRSLNLNGHISWTSHIKRLEPPLYDFEHYAPCWSLAALLKLMPKLQSKEDEITEITGAGIIISPYIGVNFCCYINQYGRIEIKKEGDTSVDACYEMILKLHELNLL